MGRNNSSSSKSSKSSKSSFSPSVSTAPGALSGAGAQPAHSRSPPAVLGTTGRAFSDSSQYSPTSPQTQMPPSPSRLGGQQRAATAGANGTLSSMSMAAPSYSGSSGRGAVNGAGHLRSGSSVSAPYSSEKGEYAPNDWNDNYDTDTEQDMRSRSASMAAAKRHSSDHHANVYTKCGRYSDEWLFGGLAEKVKKLLDPNRDRNEKGEGTEEDYGHTTRTGYRIETEKGGEGEKLKERDY